MMSVFIQPHERAEAMEAYRDWLTPNQIDEIMDAAETAIIMLVRGASGTRVQIIEEA